VPEYFWFDPFSGEWAGFTLRCGRYEALVEDAQGRLVSRRLGLALVRWQGVYQEVEARWLRCSTLAGALLPTSQEVAAASQQQAAKAQQQAAEAQRLAEAVPLFAGLLSVPLPAERYAPLTLMPHRRGWRSWWGARSSTNGGGRRGPDISLSTP
jgi:hypothetical protein